VFQLDSIGRIFLKFNTGGFYWDLSRKFVFYQVIHPVVCLDFLDAVNTNNTVDTTELLHDLYTSSVVSAVLLFISLIKFMFR